MRQHVRHKSDRYPFDHYYRFEYYTGWQGSANSLEFWVHRKGINTMSMYKIFMIVGVVVVAGGWIAYAIWDYKMRQIEKNQPKPRSAKQRKTQGELSDWAKKMAEFKKPVAKRQARGDQSDD
jgi:hypothetical protein